MDDSGAVVWQAAYLPYGQAQILVEGVVNNLRFAGQYYDSESGMHYNWNRYYDPETGRYITADPIGLEGGINLYGYVQNDPVNFIDPRGLFVFGSRRLSRLPWIPGISINPILGLLNLELSHEQGFFEDGSGENIGFSNNGRFEEVGVPEDLGYSMDYKHYDDALMREALNNIDYGKYSVVGSLHERQNNCQDWADDLRGEYEILRKSKRPDLPHFSVSFPPMPISP